MKSSTRSICFIGAGLLFSLVAAGCQKPLLAPTDERSPYDRYDAVRNQNSPQYITDEFGRRRPDLRGRLLPKD